MAQDNSSKSSYFGRVKRPMGGSDGANGRGGLWMTLGAIMALMANVAYLGYFTGKYSERIDNMQVRLKQIPRVIPPASVTDTLGTLELRVEMLERYCPATRWDSGSWDDLGGGGK